MVNKLYICKKGDDVKISVCGAVRACMCVRVYVYVYFSLCYYFLDQSIQAFCKQLALTS